MLFLLLIDEWLQRGFSNPDDGSSGVWLSVTDFSCLDDSVSGSMLSFQRIRG